MGKSLGTIPIIDKLIDDYTQSKFIALTPLLKYDFIMKSLQDSQSNILIIIGKKDHHYIKEKVEVLKKKTNIKVIISFALTIFQNVNTFIERKNLNIIEIMENTSLFRYKKILYNLENK
ncbi:hypothetical protein LC087_18000 [Bacillus carboniphilus]|uniref:Tetrapyrrole methylase domain-containing protein n=1 Tax=Bacillus carboniphilus TaxID=86663 RepID=A0ABY9JVN7_9BACI|nr:hypothetical protein [Bacillus carboniphilus]WLR42553.1 hypothetical protein LC087_18000 [Bacillus carboniphilus]